MLLGFFRVFCRINQSGPISQSFLLTCTGKLGKFLLESLICFPEGYCRIRGMLKFNTLPRLADYSFAKSVLMAVHLGMSACSPLETLKDV